MVDVLAMFGDSTDGSTISIFNATVPAMTPRRCFDVTVERRLADRQIVRLAKQPLSVA
jgi:hypothetical protein